MTDDSGIGSIARIDDCTITENNMENILYYKYYSGKDVLLEFHLLAGEDNSMVYLKFTVTFAEKTFRYWIHPDDVWLKHFCQTRQVSIIDPSKNILASLNIPKDKLMEVLSDIPQCKGWIEK